ncbi:MAG TPA: transporter associated domain-containing protein, partial [Rhizomicrobium sp.]
TLEDTMTMFATTQRSRIPVYEGSLDHILGFVHIKDMIWILLDRARRAEDHQPLAEFNLRTVLRDALIVPETKPVSELLLEFRARRTGLAMIVDEFGSILGLATLEDILEQMVGEIHDEFDVVERPLTLPDGGMIFDAAIKIRELAARYNIILPEDPSYETVGGFVLTRLGFIPRGSESFEADGYRFTVMEMDHRRVSRVKIKQLPPAIVPSPTQDPAPPQSAEVAHSEQKDLSAEHHAPAEVLQMPLQISAADSRRAKKTRRTARKKSAKARDTTDVPSPDEPAPDSPSSGPAHK